MIDQQVLGGREQREHCTVSSKYLAKSLAELSPVFLNGFGFWIVSKMQNVPNISKNHTGMMMMWTSQNESSIVGLCRHAVGSIFSCSSQTKTWESYGEFTYVHMLFQRSVTFAAAEREMRSKKACLACTLV